MKLVSLVLAIAATSSAFGQDATAPKAAASLKDIAANDKLPEGWSFTGVTGGRFTLDTAKDVSGQDDGSTLVFGLNLSLGANFKQDTHRVESSLIAGLAFSKTPTLPRYVKSADEFNISSLYTFGLPTLPEVGPYARFKLSTTMMPGRAEGTDEKDYTLVKSNGDVDNKITTSLRLTESFAPVTTRESVGFFYRVVEAKDENLLLRAGFGAEQLSRANGQFTLKDNKDTTGTIEGFELKSYSIAGVEAGFNAFKTLGPVTLLTLDGDLLYPLVISDSQKQGLSGGELLIWEIKAKASTKVMDWLTAGYELKVKKQPLVSKKTQIQNGVVLTASYNFL